MRFSFLLLALMLPWHADARPGLVSTLDGRALNGDVQFTNGLFVVDVTNAVPLTNLLSLAFDIAAGPDASSRGRGLGLLGYYFANTNFAGAPYVRLDETIDFDWGGAEPAPDVPKNHFSVIWTGEVEAPESGDYTLFIAARDGGRLFIGDRLQAESVAGQQNTGATSAPVALRANHRVAIRFEFVSTSSETGARLLWMGPGTPKSIIPKDRLFARGKLTNHTATADATASGLLATYYTHPDFTGATWTRIDPGIDFDWSNVDPLPGFMRTNFSVRWSGQLLADHTETYTFHVLADEPARLWIDGRLLLATGGDNFFFERRESIPLTTGDRYDIRYETHSTAGNATAKLAWSSPSTPKAPVPGTHLFPSRPTPSRKPNLNLTDKTAPGVLLRNNTFLGGTVSSATESSLRLSGHAAPISVLNLARIILQPMSKKLEERIVPGRTGLLLTRGDFVDTEFKGIEGGQVRSSSILFGPRSYDAAKDVLAVVLGPHAPSASSFEIRLINHSVLYASSVAVEDDLFIVRDTLAGTLKIAFADLAQIKRTR